MKYLDITASEIQRGDIIPAIFPQPVDAIETREAAPAAGGGARIYVEFKGAYPHFFLPDEPVKVMRETKDDSKETLMNLRPQDTELDAAKKAAREYNGAKPGNWAYGVRHPVSNHVTKGTITATSEADARSKIRVPDGGSIVFVTNDTDKAMFL